MGRHVVGRRLGSLIPCGVGWARSRLMSRPSDSVRGVSDCPHRPFSTVNRRSESDFLTLATHANISIRVQIRRTPAEGSALRDISGGGSGVGQVGAEGGRGEQAHGV